MFPLKLTKLLTRYKNDFSVNIDNKNNFTKRGWIEKSQKINSPLVDMIDCASNSLERDLFNYDLTYVDGASMQMHLIKSDTKITADTKVSKSNRIKYRFSNKLYNVVTQIPMIKLFIAVLLGSKHIDYTVSASGVISFSFNLYDDTTEKYDYKVNISVDDRLLVDNDNKPIILDSESLLDHMLLKAFIKLSNILDVSIKDINVNSLVGVCRGGRLFRLGFDSEALNRLHASEFSVSNLVNNKCQTMNEKEEQSLWIGDNILRVIIGDVIDPYNSHAKIIYELYKSDMLLGITINDSFFYCVSDMSCDQFGSLTIKFYNIFTGQAVPLSFETVAYGLKHIGVVV